MSSVPPPGARDRGEPRQRVITLKLDQVEGRGSWRQRLGASGHEADRHIRLVGSEIIFEHPEALRSPLALAAGLVAVATVDHGSSERAGRFAILRRLSRTAVVPQSEGVEGWLWTTGSGSALPTLGEAAPNLALVFVKPLEPEIVEGAFRPDFLAAVAQRSPLGAPTIFGLLARVTDVAAAENAFTQLGVIGQLTDREVAPAQRRHLPTDVAANASFEPVQDERRSRSVGPPGLERRSGDR